MYTLEELKTWWEVPAIAHFFSLFKSCFALTDFTIEELEESLLTDGEDDKSTIFTSRLLTELLQGCYDNPNISVTTYHDTLIHIMKKRWEEEDGRVNPLSSINADFHSLPTQLKVQIIHRLTEYRLDASDVEVKLSGLNPSDLRLEPLGLDRNGSKYWYFFGVRLYKETPPDKRTKKRKRVNKVKKKEMKKAKLHSGKINESFLKLVNGDRGHTKYEDASVLGFPNSLNERKSKKKSKKKHKKGKENLAVDSPSLGFRYGGLSESKWEVVCYNVDDWKGLATKLGGGESRREESLCQLITDNFLPNLPKIVEDMEMQKLQKEQSELLPRRSSCRLLAKKLYEEEDGEMGIKHTEEMKREQEEREEIQNKERDKRMRSDFEKLLQVEIERKRKDRHAQWKKEWEERRRKRLSQGLPPDSDSSSDECFMDDSVHHSRLQPPTNESISRVSAAKKEKLTKKVSYNDSAALKVEAALSKRKGRPPSNSGGPKISKLSEPSKKPAARGRKKSKDSRKSEDADEDEWDEEYFTKIAENYEYIAMKEAWEALDSNPDAWPFESPVEEWYAPGYHNIIKRPMDLSSIETKLNERKYKTVLEFKDDITLMFNNCRLYNGPDNEYTQVANNLDKLFKKTLYIGLTRNQASTKPSNAKTNNKGGRKKSQDEVVVPEVPEEIKSNALLDDVDEDLDEEDAESDEESSDEFTPPGVSKSKLKKSRLEAAGRGRGRGGRGGGRGRGRRPSLPGKTRRSSYDVEKLKEKSESGESESDVSASERTTTKRRLSTNHGREAKSTTVSRRGRKASVDVRQKKTNNKKSSSESSDESDEKPATPRRRGRSRGAGTYRGRGRGKRTTARSKSTGTNSSVSEESDENNSDVDVPVKPVENPIFNDKKDDNNGVPSSAKSTDSSKVPETPNSRLEKYNESPSRDAESSSSSSRASSRSHSLEKFEKLEEDAKSKPQVLWSLDYLASQARVLEEQYRKTESSTSSSRPSSSKKQNSQPNTPASDMKTNEVEDNKKIKASNSPSPQQRLNRTRRKDSGATNLSPGDAHRSYEGVQSRKDGSNVHKTFSASLSRKAPSDGRRRDDNDVYSFNEEDSPAGVFPNKSNVDAGKMPNEPVNKVLVGSQTDNANTPGTGMPHEQTRKSPSFPSPAQVNAAHVRSGVEVDRNINTKSRNLSTEQLSSPQTPSSGYGSNKTISSSTSLFPSSPYAMSDSGVVLPQNKLTEKTRVTDHNTDTRNDIPISKSAPAVKPNPTEDLSGRNQPHNQPTQRVDTNKQPLPHTTSQNLAGRDDKPAQNTSNSRDPAINPSRPNQHQTQPPIPTPTQQPPFKEQPSSNPPSINTNNNARPQYTSQSSNARYQTVATSQAQAKPGQVSVAGRRHSQSMLLNQTSVKSPGYQHTTTAMLAANRSDPTESVYANTQRTEKHSALIRQPSSSNQGAPTEIPPQHPQHTRPPPYHTQLSGPHVNPTHPQQHQKQNQPVPDQRQLHPAHPRGFEQRPQNRTVEPGYRNTNPASSSNPQQAYNYGTSSTATSGANRNSTATSSRENAPNYHQRGNQSAPFMQNPTMESFGLTPLSLSQPHHEEQNRTNADATQTAPRKNSNPSAGYPTPKATNLSSSLPQQNLPQQRQTQSTRHYHSTTSTSMTSAPTHSQQHNPPSGIHHPPAKHRNTSTSNTPDTTNNPPPAKHHQRHTNTNTTASAHSASASGHTGSGQSGSNQSITGHSTSNRRQSSNTAQYQQKSHTDYMGYHIPPTPAPTPRDGRAPTYSPQQNGLLSAATAGAVSNIHQDLTASATLRALQQQHKSDRPSHAASMFHYAAAAAAQQSQGAAAAVANEQYNRLAATAHHRATSQHTHPLAGVYHPHHQNAATSSAHQAATHLSSPWLQAAAAAPGAGYPSNLLPHPHMDPVYHLMQQSGMHGQYPMYPNHVMQQLHQQHLQHHMLPKY